MKLDSVYVKYFNALTDIIEIRQQEIERLQKLQQELEEEYMNAADDASC